jgi:LPS sulfotransferase NodH
MFGILTDFDEPGYASELAAKAVTPNGVFAAKLMWPTMQQLLARSCESSPGGIVPWLGSPSELRYLHISRDDDVQQAISLLLAMRTDYWQKMTAAPVKEGAASWTAEALRLEAHAARPRLYSTGALTRWSLDEVQRELDDPAQRDTLMTEIDTHRRMINDQQRAWAGFFREHRITPFPVRYEDLVAGPSRVVRDIVEFLALPDCAPDLDAVHLRPLSDARNVLLARCYGMHLATRGGDQN